MPAATAALAERSPGQEPSFFKTVDGGDVRMIQRGEELRFALKPADALGIVGERRRQKLDGYVATDLPIARAIDHAAFTQGRKNLVRTENQR